MKKHLAFIITIIYLILIKTFSLHAQTNKGSMMVGFQFGGKNSTSNSEYSTYPDYNTEYKYNVYRPALNFHYFYYNKLSAGFKLGYIYETTQNKQTINRSNSYIHNYPVSLILTKYINLTPIMNFYMGIFLTKSIGRGYSYSYQNEIEKEYFKSTYKGEAFGLNFGLMANLNKRWAIKMEVVGIEKYNNSANQSKNRDTSDKGWTTDLDKTQLSLGLTYIIRRTEAKETSK